MYKITCNAIFAGGLARKDHEEEGGGGGGGDEEPRIIESGEEMVIRS